MNARAALCAVLTFATISTVLPGAPARAASCVELANVPVPAKGTGIRVEQLCREALTLQQLDNVRLIGANDSERVAALTLGYQFVDGEGLVVPEASSADIASDRGNRIHAANGIRTTVRRDAPNGESYDLEGSGNAAFNIANPLDFWTVYVARRFIAAVHGTLFSVDLGDPQNVTFTVTRGTVTITRFVTARILSSGELLEGLRTSVKISPEGTSSVTYSRAPEIYRTFKDRVDARTQLNKDLENAKQSKDPDDTEDATDNLMRLDSPAAPPSVASATASAPAPPFAPALIYAAVGAGIAASIIDALVSNKTQSSAPRALSTSEPGTIGVSSHTAAFRGLLGSVLRSFAKSVLEHRQARAPR